MNSTCSPLEHGGPFPAETGIHAVVTSDFMWQKANLDMLWPHFLCECYILKSWGKSAVSPNDWPQIAFLKRNIEIPLLHSTYVLRKNWPAFKIRVKQLVLKQLEQVVQRGEGGRSPLWEKPNHALIRHKHRLGAGHRLSTVKYVTCSARSLVGRGLVCRMSSSAGMYSSWWQVD